MQSPGKGCATKDRQPRSVLAVQTDGKSSRSTKVLFSNAWTEKGVGSGIMPDRRGPPSVSPSRQTLGFVVSPVADGAVSGQVKKEDAPRIWQGTLATQHWIEKDHESANSHCKQRDSSTPSHTPPLLKSDTK